MITSLLQLFLAIVVLVGAYMITKRLRNLEDTLYAVTGENEALQQKVADLEKALQEQQQGKAEAVSAESVEKDSVIKVPAEQPAAPIESEPVPEPPAPREDGLTPEVVAVIMATIAAYGYSPAAIRSIRKTPSIQRSQNWLIAGRMANMR